jgi:hypothetical protein
MHFAPEGWTEIGPSAYQFPASLLWVYLGEFHLTEEAAQRLDV